MDTLRWVWSEVGLRGPRYLIEQAEWQLEGERQAALEGVPLLERDEPVITALLLCGLLAAIQPASVRWRLATMPLRHWGSGPANSLEK